MAADFVFECEARNWRTGIIVAVIWLMLAAAWLWFDAAWWVLGFLGLFTLPAIYDLARNPASGLTLTNDQLTWHSGRRRADVALAEVDHIRLDTRLDFSVRATVVTRTGRKIRLPFECTPPHRAFESALQDHGLAVQRHHFQLLQ
ncbi:hypothetical protein SAMN04488523_10920 [Sulfitobacter brevis]|uniref:PH domain-containing protein n=1 Tax=Sulfitobacter brevis TaxID=74348 RepID=A0A1I2C9E5_9RHOB|nr:hypothetical protein [Sulfitobacter brevis]SFE64423.1 hypothetical protein SAMN04488523_10920 [Sulfitobacter brevis]